MAAAKRLQAALALWRGAAYAEIADESFAQPEIRRLEELRLRAIEDRIEADLALGRHHDVIGELETLVAADPLRERLRGQLMTALYRAGRQAEALRTYQEGRRLLSEELGIDPSPELQRLEGWILAQDARLDGPAQRRAVRNPYKGLRPFGEQDSADFFGRESLIARLLERLGQVARAGRFLAVVGPSGCGKSSVIRAGLVPALRAGALPGSERWLVALMSPGAHPMREMAAALRAPGAGTPARVDIQLERRGGLATAVERIVPKGGRLLLVVDQFEELYSLVEDEHEREHFVTSVVEALTALDGRLLVAVALRADFFDRPLLSSGFGELVRTGTEIVTPLARDELERAIGRPAAAVGVQLEPGLATEVIGDVGRQPGALPLLQYALTELFEGSDRERLTREGYAAVGGVLGALGRRAEEVHAALAADGREIARQVFLRLVSSGESGEATARRVPRAGLQAIGDDPRRVDEVLGAFDRGRLLSFDRDAVTGEPTVQVAHEALLARWSRLAGWIDEAREDLWTRRRLAEAAAEWIRADRSPGFLLSGSRLDLFAAWATSTDLRLDRPERELLDASAAERRRLDDADAERTMHERAVERRAATRLRALVAVLAIAAIVASSLSVVVYRQGEAANEQSAIAVARELAAASIGNLGTDPQLSLLLAWQAGDATADRGYVVEQAMDAMHWAMQADHVAYDASDTPFAVRESPGGARGVMLVAPDHLMRLVATAAHRVLTPDECRTYLHQPACPGQPTGPGPVVTNVLTASGTMPAAGLATATLAGTRVTVVSQLPVDLKPLVAAFGTRTSIDVVEATGAAADLEARVASGDLPDVAIVSRPALVAELARERLLVDLSPFVDVASLRAAAGDYLVGLGTVDTDGTWPASHGDLYGVTFATEAESLIWYPKAEFDEAGYTVPRTWDELTALTQKMVGNGQTPWCLGLEAGSDSGASAAGFVEDLVLHTAGPDVYDQWAAGSQTSSSRPVGTMFAAFDKVVADGYVDGGRASAILMPPAIAALPMLVDPPGCWLHLGGGIEHASLPAAGSAMLAAFPFPAADTAYSDAVRGRALTVVVFHDRPEVRRFVGSLLGDEYAAAATASLVPAGIWPLRSAALPTATDEVARLQGELLGSAIRADAFRVSAADLMPRHVAVAVDLGMVQYVREGPFSLAGVLAGIDAAWRESK